MQIGVQEKSTSSLRPMSAAASLAQKIRKRSANVGVIGLGYVGLPLAIEMAQAGFQITGIDIDSTRVESVNAGISYVPDVPSESLFRLVIDEKLKASQSLAVVQSLDTISICVPTPLRKSKDPDLSYVIASVEAVQNHLRPGQLIVLESTTYPGTTRELVLPILEKSGLVVGQDFFLAYSPERIDPGNRTNVTRNIPKVISGITPRCTELATLFYQQFIETMVPVCSTESAEMVKLLENTFRSVNIALVNEVAMMCHKFNIDVWEVIDAAKTKPFGYMPFYPGPGLGGHCLPVDPYYLTWKAKINGFQPQLIEIAALINSQMPHFTVSRILDALNEKQKSVKGSKILGIGVAYKRDTNDVRESPAIEVLDSLRRKGAQVFYSDPHVSSIKLDGHTYASVPCDPETLRSMDCAIILTDHSVFDYATIVAHSAVIVDSRNVLKDFPRTNIVSL